MLGSPNHGAFNLFLEYVSGGSLSDLCRRSGKLDELTVRRYARGILEGLSHVHRHGFVHCDTKPSNVLLDPVSGVKIADFGLAKRLGERAPPEATIQGTPMYMSPEVAAGGQPAPASDVLSLGCTFIELVTGKPPWDVPGGGAGNVVQLLYRIGISNESPEIPAGLSEQGKDFLGRCFEKDPRRRWTAEMLLHHEFCVLERRR
ncbi:mitogen-activated protein kinase kinase kinase 20-like [Nymphaea colorata]|uniref:mitogen-activated protein kinase kinase kinase 20-like n=1 Tax=Nymphaea colorata TaxID=210225 RepID=UPI00129EB7BB|nr:mitogen-activated protein kinase kinase kinase 20-like [Nymphaea colorata]